jgi:hypothetical protein
VPRLDLADFLQKTGFSLKRLATYLRVAPTYLEAALAGTARLTTRDQQACRLLWRRLFQAKQMQLPFAEPLESFTRTHARARARARATGSTQTGESTRSVRARSSRPAKRSRVAKSRQS